MAEKKKKDKQKMDGYIEKIGEKKIRSIFSDLGYSNWVDLALSGERGLDDASFKKINEAIQDSCPENVSKRQQDLQEFYHRHGKESVDKEIRRNRLDSGKNVDNDSFAEIVEGKTPIPVNAVQAINKLPVAEPEPTTAFNNQSIDDEIEALRGLIGKPEFSDALDNLLDSLEAAGLDSQYETVVSDIINQDAQAEMAKVGL